MAARGASPLIEVQRDTGFELSVTRSHDGGWRPMSITLVEAWREPSRGGLCGSLLPALRWRYLRIHDLKTQAQGNDHAPTEVVFEPCDPVAVEQSLIFRSENTILISFLEGDWDRAQEPVLAER
jgi:hypothetical protein